MLDAGRIIGALREGGAVAGRLERFEPRQAQLDLMELIIRCFNEDAIGAAEAGTGVGKSFAYLLPALYHAADTGERVVISTATINLQQQLFGKDIPLVRSAINAGVKAVLVKGRGNYLCRRRLEDAVREPDLAFGDDQEQLEEIIRWADTAKSGGRDELPFVPAENIWSRVCSDAEMCMGKWCPYQDRCFILALRREASAARVVVVNHHLLFADLAARKSGAGYEAAAVLPPYSRLVIDEAHNIENAATSFFSREFGKVGILRLSTRLYRKRGIRRGGLLTVLCSRRPRGLSGLETLAAALDKVRLAVSVLDAASLELCGGDGVFRFSPRRNAAAAEAAIFAPLAALRKSILGFTGAARELLEEFPEKDGEDSAVWECKVILRRLDEAADMCGAFAAWKENQDDVLWIERRGGKEPWAAFIQSPVELAENLGKSLFAPHKTVVCVSATLAVNGSFSYWASRSGADRCAGRPFFSGSFPSPFPYSSEVLLASPGDAPLPDEPGYQDFVNDAVERLAAVSGGSALILFTSYQSLHSAWLAAEPSLRELGITCLKQGGDDRSRLLKAFLEDKTSVLFATDSFWEGVDAPGDTLRLVVLCRLPFRTPNDPVFEARRETIENNGGSPFMDLSLPEAVMKFKQGFGRLMRRSSDRGVVAVLDGRLIRKKYGALFLNSLPETKVSFSGFEGILRDMERFLFS